MSEHLTRWLGAYHDGELRGARLRRMERHLDECPDCRAELDAIRSLSSLLVASPPEAEFLPTERFAANLALHLPRRPEPQGPRTVIEFSWWLVPVGLLAVWVFIGTTYALSSVVSLAAGSGLFNGQLAWLGGSPLQMDWFASATRLFGDLLGAPGRAALASLSDANLFVARLVRSLLPQAAVALAYLGWLFAWWLRQKESPTQETGLIHRD